jgi:hypothetical protein
MAASIRATTARRDADARRRRALRNYEPLRWIVDAGPRAPADRDAVFAYVRSALAEDGEPRTSPRE